MGDASGVLAPFRPAVRTPKGPREARAGAARALRGAAPLCIRGLKQRGIKAHRGPLGAKQGRDQMHDYAELTKKGD